MASSSLETEKPRHINETNRSVNSAAGVATRDPIGRDKKNWVCCASKRMILIEPSYLAPERAGKTSPLIAAKKLENPQDRDNRIL